MAREGKWDRDEGSEKVQDEEFFVAVLVGTHSIRAIYCQGQLWKLQLI